MAKRTVRSYQARDVRPKHIHRFRGITIPELGTNSGDPFVDESFNAISRKLRLLETRIGQTRALTTSIFGCEQSSIFEEDIQAVLSEPRIIALSEGGRVWFESRDPSPNRIRNVDQFVIEPQVPFLDPPNITEECSHNRSCINHPPPVGVSEEGSPVGVGENTGGEVSPRSGNGNPDLQQTMFPPWDLDGGDPASPRETAVWEVQKEFWVDLPMVASTSHYLELEYALDEYDYQKYGIKYIYPNGTENIQEISISDLKGNFIVNLTDYPDPKSGGVLSPVALVRICRYSR